MPLYDSAQDRLILRVVYDGPGIAGKTTNVERLSTDFEAGLSSGLFDAGRLHERTQFFECMHVDGGLVEGCRLRALFVTVPGQDELRGRRLALLEGADAVVFVCDSSTDGMPRAREMYEDLCQYLGGLGRASLPVIVQANKQDLPGALDTRQVARALGLVASAVVVPARALLGIGVRETAVLAARAAAARVRQSISIHGFASVARQSGAPEQLLESVRAIPVGRGAPTDDARVLHALADLAVAAKRGEEATPRSQDGSVGPSLPGPGLPASHVWPATTGSEVLDRVCGAGVPVLRSEFGAAPDGKIVFEVGPWRLETSARSRSSDIEAAYESLRCAADQRTELDRLLPPRSALFLVEARDGAFWLWTVRPWMRTLEERLQSALTGSSAAQLDIELQAYAEAALDALSIAIEGGLLLDLAPAQLATVGQRVSYLGVDLPSPDAAWSMGEALLQHLAGWGASREVRDNCSARVAALLAPDGGRGTESLPRGPRRVSGH